MENQHLFDQLGKISVEIPEISTPLLCKIEILNNCPADLQVYLYGACEFVYQDGSTYTHNRLNRVYRQGKILWQSNSNTNCVRRVNIAIIAKSDIYPGAGNYSLVDEVSKDECIIERGWSFGALNRRIDDKEILSSFELKVM